MLHEFEQTMYVCLHGVHKELQTHVLMCALQHKATCRYLVFTLSNCMHDCRSDAKSFKVVGTNSRCSFSGFWTLVSTCVG